MFNFKLQHVHTYYQYSDILQLSGIIDWIIFETEDKAIILYTAAIHWLFLVDFDQLGLELQCYSLATIELCPID